MAEVAKRRGEFELRVDLLIPLDTEVNVKLEEVVFGGRTVVAVGK